MVTLARRTALAAALLGAVLLPMACDSGPTGPAGQVSLVLQPRFSATGDLASNAQLVDRVRVVLETEGEVVLDTLILWPLDQDTLSIAVTVSVQSGTTQTFDYTLEGLAGEVLLFDMSGSVDIAGAEGEGNAVVADTFSYVGPGAEAAAITIDAAPASMLAADTVRLTATITDAGGAVVSAPTVWSTTDTAVGRVDTTGLVEARHVVRDTAVVIARVAYRSLADTVRIPLLSAGARFLASADTLTALQDTVTLPVTALGVDGEPARGGLFTFAALDPGVADVDAVTDTTVRVRSGSNGSARFAATGGGFSDTATVQVEQRADHVVVTPADTAFEALGDTIQMAATVFDYLENPILAASVSWSSSAPEIVAVDTAGRAFALQAGSAEIAAEFGAVADTALLGVDQVLDTFFVAPDTLPLSALDLTFPMAAVGLDPNGAPIAGLDVTWSSEDDAIVAVDEAGVVTALAQGTTRLVAAAGDRSDTAVVVVDQVVTSIGLTPATDTLDALGATATFTAAPTDLNGHAVPDAAVTWTCSDAAILDCGTAQATAVSVGDAEITAAVDEDDIAETAAIHVRQLPVSLDVLQDSTRLDALQDQDTLTVSAEDANGNPLQPSQVTWTSRAAAIATIDGAGVATAQANGAAWVVASGGSLQDSALVRVLQVPTQITVSPADTTVEPLQSFDFAADVLDGNGFTVASPGLTWTSTVDTVIDFFNPSDPTAQTGFPGEALVIATTFNELADTASVLVLAPDMQVDVVPSYDTISIGGQVDLALRATADSADPIEDVPDVVWSSLEELVAMVDTAGLVTGVGSGVAPIVGSIQPTPDTTLVDTAFVVVADSGDIVSTAFVKDSLIEASFAAGNVFGVPITLDMSRVDFSNGLGFVDIELRFDSGVLAFDSAHTFFDAAGPVEQTPGVIVWSYSGSEPRQTSTFDLVILYFTVTDNAIPGTKTLLDLEHTQAPRDHFESPYSLPISVDGRVLILEPPEQPPS